MGRSDEDDVDEPSAFRGGGIASNQLNAIGAASSHHAVVELPDLPGCRMARQGQGNQQIFRSSAHGSNVAEIGDGGPKTDVREGGGMALEMDALCEQIGRE